VKGWVRSIAVMVLPPVGHQDLEGLTHPSTGSRLGQRKDLVKPAESVAANL
jgi:hypothetical protein